ncbi:hypothetical protein GT037_003289 [Alternaria burnsii]|uniref:Heterokaryon incompatibility domain-containing protein n=1 Tax=Alternaria burnsii TaxID=1187904 RepID=A0A8H7EIX0_9PLEO|nr:uncharacterized protein GT037_003289 [Alternaria burnsii]KAF7679541.1 hypothetical protein GT037_003289 [Alternaria burnsii]
MRSDKKRVTSRVGLTETFITRSSERISKRRTVALEDRVPATEHKIRTTRRNERKKIAVPKSSQRVLKRRTVSRKRYESPEEPEVYKHQRLDTSTDEIRLLKLSRETKGPVHCEVKVFPLERAPEYIALSYRWGPPSPLHDLYIEGRKLEIRDILNSCLLELREDLEAWLWIDQICVAQEDSLERNHQVGMMSRIYSNSMSVIIWKGDIPLAAPGEHDCYNDSDLDVASARVLLKNTYFTRLWIFQEVFLASSINIRINGHRCVPWDRLQDICVSNRQVDSSTFMPAYLMLQRIRRQALGALELYLPLMDCIAGLHAGICENPRDKIYGLMGMVRKEDRVVVDYEKSVLEVYLDFLKISINTGLPSIMNSEEPSYYLELGVLMGLDDYILLGILRLTLNRFTVHKNDTVTDIGLEEAGQAHEQHRWWYECNGERHHFCCRSLSGSEISKIWAFMEWNGID